MLGADLETSTADQRSRLAQRTFLKQVQLVGAATKTVAARLLSPPQTIVLSGEGEFLARAALTQSPPGALVSQARFFVGTAAPCQYRKVRALTQ